MASDVGTSNTYAVPEGQHQMMPSEGAARVGRFRGNAPDCVTNVTDKILMSEADRKSECREGKVSNLLGHLFGVKKGLPVGYGVKVCD